VTHTIKTDSNHQRPKGQQLSSIIEPGVYRRNRDGELDAVEIRLNSASDTAGNGINLMPATPVPDNNQAIVLSATFLRRLLDAIGAEL
jgi:hypothetical protein